MQRSMGSGSGEIGTGGVGNWLLGWEIGRRSICGA